MFLYRCVECGARRYSEEKFWAGQRGQSRWDASVRVSISNSSFREPAWDEQGRGFTRLIRVTTVANVSCHRCECEHFEYFGRQTMLEVID